MQFGTWLGGWKFLKPTNPQETLALLIAITVLLGLGAGAAKAVEGLFRDDPWNVQADRICLRAGNEYLSVEGSPVEQEMARIEITEQALSDLESIKRSVPLATTLTYQSMLKGKSEVLRLFKRRLEAMREGESTTYMDDRLRSEFSAGYGLAAEELDLHICGQNSGKQ